MRRTWFAIRELAVKDWKLFLADRRGVLLCFTVPCVLAILFGAMFDRPGVNVNRLPLLVIGEQPDDGDHGLVKVLSSDARLDVLLTDEPTARVKLGERGAKLALVVPTMTLWHAPGCELESRVAEGIITELLCRQTLQARLGPLAAGFRPSVLLHETVPAGTAARVSAYGHSFCGMSLQYLLFWGMDCGLLLLRDRGRGTWHRLRAAPVSPWAFLAGKALSTLVVALLLLAVTLTVGTVGFGIPLKGSILVLLFVGSAVASLAVAVGLVVATLGVNEARARSVSILTILLLSMLGGLWLPAFLMPHWVRRVAELLPTSWALRALEGVTWRGLPSREVILGAGLVYAASAVLLALAAWRFTLLERAPAGGELT